MAHIDKERPEEPRKFGGHGVCPARTRVVARDRGFDARVIEKPHEPDEGVGLLIDGRKIGPRGLGGAAGEGSSVKTYVCKHCRCTYAPKEKS